MIIIHPFAQKLRGGGPNPKNYPFWKELIPMIDERIVQVGVDGEEKLVEDFRKNLSIGELTDLVKECRTWIGVDSFFQHLCWDIGKPGIVLWGQSDPLIFGHPENVNLLKSRDYLRSNQFLTWEMCSPNYSAFVEPKVVIDYLKSNK